MSRPDTTAKSSRAPSLDRPGGPAPSIDRPWDDPTEREHRMAAREGDRSGHRMHHGLYEDLLT